MDHLSDKTSMLDLKKFAFCHLLLIYIIWLIEVYLFHVFVLHLYRLVHPIIGLIHRF